MQKLNDKPRSRRTAPAKPSREELEAALAERERELAEARRQQTATAAVINVISRSKVDLDAVLTTLTDAARTLCGAVYAAVYMSDGVLMRLRAQAGLTPELIAYLMDHPIDPATKRGDRTHVGRAALTGEIVEIEDAPASAEFRLGDAPALGNFRAILGVPLIRESRVEGVFSLARPEPGRFPREQIELVQTFADQAVIAIENVRLFGEVQAKTRDLEESLAQQTATADVLKVISRSAFDLQTVFDTLLSSAATLCGAIAGNLWVRDGDVLRHKASFGLKPEFRKFLADYPQPKNRDMMAGRVFLSGKVEAIPDALGEKDYAAPAHGLTEARSILGVPLLRGESVEGAVILLKREPGAFPQRQIELVQTFADQAVIAIENVRLFDETQETLEREKAAGEVLSAISRSVSDASPVFERILDGCERLIASDSAAIFLVDGEGQVRPAAGRSSRGPAIFAAVRSVFPQPLERTPMHRAFQEGRVVVFRDVANDPDAPWSLRAAAEKMGSFSFIAAPMLWEGRGIGAIHLLRDANATFTDKETALLRTFAEQAVIAIQNARLFNETKEALERETATSEILQVISRSPTDAQPVFDSIVVAAVRSLRCDTAFVLLRDGDVYVHTAGATPQGPMTDLAPDRVPIDPDANFPSRAILAGETLHLPDWSQIELPEHERDIRARFGVNSALYLPLSRQGECIGLIAAVGSRPNSFGPKEIAQAESFRDQALIAIENARLFNETQEALARQTATSEILQVIAASPSDASPVFEAIAHSAKRLLGGFSATVFRFDGESAHLVAFTPTNPEADAALRALSPIPTGDIAAAPLREGEIVQIPDTEEAPQRLRDIARLRGYRAMLYVPLVQRGSVIGFVSVTRKAPGPFDPDDVALLKTFADQAVIAIDNARLFDEVQAKTRDLEEALQQQTATADVLKVISRSAFDLQAVLDTLIGSAVKMIGATAGVIALREGDGLSYRATFGMPEDYRRWLLERPFRAGRDTSLGRVLLTGEIDIIPDLLDDKEYTGPAHRLTGTRSILTVPLLRDGRIEVAFSLNRLEPGDFTPRQIELVRTFADQALIAIENVRLLDEVQAKTRDLEESLQQQTATADVLKVISRSAFDLRAVLETLVESGVKLSGANRGSIFLRDGDAFRFHTASSGSPPEYLEFMQAHTPAANRGSTIGRVLLSGKVECIPDVLADKEFNFRAPALAHVRATLGVPLLREDRVEGVIVLGRFEPGPFTRRQIELVQTFADQAVIAIENVRLFDEVQARTRDLEELLQQQTATADVLKVISRSAFDLQAVLDALLDSAIRLSGVRAGGIALREGEALRIRAEAGRDPSYIRELKGRLLPTGRGSISGRVLLSGMVEQIPDVRADPEFDVPAFGSFARLGVPMLRNGKVEGVIVLVRDEPGSFSPRVIDLVQTFADQAVIALENVRLFDEVQAKTRDLEEALQQQTATADVLKVISRSTFDLDAVLKTLTKSAHSLSGAATATVFLRDGEVLRIRAESGVAPEFLEYLVAHPIPSGRETGTGRVLMTGETVHIPDVLADPDYNYGAGPQLGDYRALLGVPLVRDGKVEGVFGLQGREPGAFKQRQIELVRTFADQAVIAIGNVRLFDEVQAKTRDLEESLQQQTATADVLKVISRSAFDLQSVLDTLIKSAVELSDADKGSIHLRDGDVFPLRAASQASAEYREFWSAHPPGPGRKTIVGRVALSGKVESIADILDDEEFGVPPSALAPVRAVLGVPLLREGRVEGVLVLSRYYEPGPFSRRQIELVQTFADQAVIAIENVRLFDEVQAKTRDLEESLQQQTATADVLKVISRSAFDLQTVLDTLVSSAVKLCGATDGIIYLKSGDTFTIKAHAFESEDPEVTQFLRDHPQRPGRGSVGGRVLLTGEVQNIRDTHADAEYDPALLAVTTNRALLGVPLKRDASIVGAIVLARREPGEFDPRQIELVKTFADQAVIAIENVRLFDEVQAKTRDLEESLQQQTATADVLKVISRSAFDLNLAAPTILETAARLCRASRATLHLRDGDVCRLATQFGMPEAFEREARDHPIPVRHPLHSRRPARAGEVAHYSDAWSDPDYLYQSTARLGGYRAIVVVPLMREGELVGIFSLGRPEPDPFTDSQIKLTQTFADQAAIAIENARLFEEVQARTREVEQALEQQTATADVLKAISRAAFDLDTVLETLISTAVRLCGARYGEIFRRYGDVYRYAATHAEAEPAYIEHERTTEIRPGRGTLVGRVASEGRAVEIADAWTDPEYAEKDKARIGNVRAMLGVPLLRNGEPVGAFALARSEPVPFTKRQVELVATFADQAVIAIENVRLFDEVQAKTRDLEEALQQQTATANVLQVISRSAFDLQTVLTTLAESARELCGASFVTLSLREGDEMRLRAESGCTPEIVAFLHAHPIRAGRETFTGRVMLTGEPVHLPDVLADREYSFGEGPRIGNYRALLAVPLLREGRVEGVFALARPEAVAFTERQIEMVRAFADQAVIAIENARLFDEVQSRTRELAASLDDLRKAQDRLIQSEKLASLGQLTAGIAHEIKNPLNFVNNFSGLSREMLGELRDLIANAPLDPRTREEAAELMATVASNLDKVVQHGKRADSIVKNMLLHSRSGSGERASVNVNALVEEALNLAYHGARAEKPGFNVTIEKSLDPNAGAAELYPQEVTRVLLNLISNGFYATTKRKREDTNPEYEPTLAASTRDLGEEVEIVVRDNGTGIPDEVKGKMFNPFFTTKPAGEGTGLGLSLSHDIVVKQHGGTIEVATEPGAYTEFTIRLPRSAASSPTAVPSPRLRGEG